MPILEDSWQGSARIYAGKNLLASDPNWPYANTSREWALTHF